MSAAQGDDPILQSLTPRRIVAELDRYIVGQKDAKRAAAVAIRNRWRRRRLSPDQQRDILPKNILFVGPTGVGKTEIARRLASLVRAPFVKVEATKFTEVGYVGRDVDGMVRDLADAAYDLVRREAMAAVMDRAQELAEDRLLDLLLPGETPASGPGATKEDRERRTATREKIRAKLRTGDLDLREVEVRSTRRGPNPMVNVFSNAGFEQMGFDLQNLAERLGPPRFETRRATVKEARAILEEDEAEKLLDPEKIRRDAIERAESQGVIFIDEMDKIVGSRTKGAGGVGPDVSREGVQRDLLPIVEGSAVNTRHGIVRTDHVLFMGAGAFHASKPSDLIPELQGRFPIRVELSSLGSAELRRILVEPENALTRQYAALLQADGVDLRFDASGLDAITEIATRLNEKMEDIGARRLHTVMEKLLEDPLFDAPEAAVSPLLVDRAFVERAFASLRLDDDQSRFIL